MEAEYQPMTQDGIFKMLTWDSEVSNGPQSCPPIGVQC